MPVQRGSSIGLLCISLLRVAPPIAEAGPQHAGDKRSQYQCKVLIINDIVQAGGVGIFARVENRQLTENATITKRSNLPIRAELERNWNIAFSSPTEHPMALGPGASSIVARRRKPPADC
jgi:hypothetical protein